MVIITVHLAIENVSTYNMANGSNSCMLLNKITEALLILTVLSLPIQPSDTLANCHVSSTTQTVTAKAISDLI